MTRKRPVLSGALALTLALFSLAAAPAPTAGTIAAGKYADVIAVRGDVLHHVDLLSNVDVVVKHGVRYK